MCSLKESENWLVAYGQKRLKGLASKGDETKRSEVVKIFSFVVIFLNFLLN